MLEERHRVEMEEKEEERLKEQEAAKKRQKNLQDFNASYQRRINDLEEAKRKSEGGCIIF